MSQLSPAEQLLKSLGVREPKEIDLDAIAYSTGATVKYRELGGCEARILGYEDKAIITIESRVINTRQRFSLGHELGHWHYDRGKSFVCRSDDIGNRRRKLFDPERIADSYAADLLLPQYIFEPMALDANKCSFEAVDVLREAFNTSITATALRMVDFGPEPAMLICHTAEGRKWFHRHKQIPEHWFPRDDLDTDSYAMEVLNGEVERTRKVVMEADSWFDRPGASKYEIYEQTQRITDGEILTLLTVKDDAILEE